MSTRVPYKRASAIARSSKVSCLMVTKNRLPFVKRAIACFQAQTYPNVELVIVDHGTDGTGALINQLNDPRLLYNHVEITEVTIGELRNLSLELATGDYIATWDDDDWHHPLRISFQCETLELEQADICMVGCITLAQPEQNLFAYSAFRPWENTLLAKKNQLLPYPSLSYEEDTHMLQQCLDAGRKICLVNAPDLYIYHLHGSNTWNAEHHNELMRNASYPLGEHFKNIVLDRLRESVS